MKPKSDGQFFIRMERVEECLLHLEKRIENIERYIQETNDLEEETNEN